MWLSRQIIKNERKPVIQSGRVTLNDNGELEAVASGVDRSVRMFSPYGYAFSLPKGEKMLLTESDGSQAAFGVEMERENIAAGEIKITSSSGAYIYLKNDGSVIINGLVIDSKGVIKNGK